MELSSSNILKFLMLLIFLEKKLRRKKNFLIFQETETPKKLLIFPKMKPCTFQSKLKK